MGRFMTQLMCLFIGYFAIWAFFWDLGTSGIVIGVSSILFLPAGLRFTAFYLFPYRYWPAIFAAELLANVYISDLFIKHQILQIMGLWVLPIALCAGVVALFKRHIQDIYFNEQRVCSKLLLCMFTVAVSIALSNNYISYSLQTESFTWFNLEFWKSLTVFIFGDVIGMLIIFPLVIFIQASVLQQTAPFNWDQKKVINLSIFVLPMLLLLYLSIEYLDIAYSRIVLMFVVVILSYTYELKGAIFSIFLNVTSILVFAEQNPEVDAIIENQTFLVTLSCLCLLLASVATNKKNLQHDLIFNNALLLRKGQDLQSALTENRQLTQDIMNVQEEERKNLARDLHDDIGQSLTGINIELTLLKKRSNIADVEANIQNIKQIVTTINESTHRLMNALHPRMLDEFGLFTALGNGDIEHILKKSGIQYRLHTLGEDAVLSQDLALAVYRIIQETASNTIKYAGASHFSVELVIQEQRLYVTIRDNGNGISAENNHGLGILGIKERVAAVAGTHTLNSNQSGTEHIIQIPLPE